MARFEFPDVLSINDDHLRRRIEWATAILKAGDAAIVENAPALQKLAADLRAHRDNAAVLDLFKRAPRASGRREVMNGFARRAGVIIDDPPKAA